MQDIIWKRIIETLFEDFVAFFLPDVYPHIDFSQPHHFLDKEFEQLFPPSKKGKRYLDKLVKVYLKNGSEQWILIHGEVQGYYDKHFEHRMLMYFSRILDRYRHPIVSLAILVDEKADWKPNRYEYSFFETELSYRYRVYKVLEQEEKQLKASDNPFSLAILACLYTFKSQQNEDKRLQFKLKLTSLLLERGYQKAKIKEVFYFIHVLLKLQDEQKQDEFIEEVSKMARGAKQVKPITDFEEALKRKYLKEGLKKGELKGLKKGELKGLKEGKIETALNMLAEGSDIAFISKVTGLSRQQIENLKQDKK